MLFKAKKGQTSYGEVIGILLIDSTVPFIHGDVGNAKTFRYPVRYKRIDGLTTKHILDQEFGLLDRVISAARELEKEGVQAITSDCGYMALFQEEVRDAVNVPVFLSSFLMIPFIEATLSKHKSIGVITANSATVTPDMLKRVGVHCWDKLVISGLQHCQNFRTAVFEEKGYLDSGMIREEVSDVAKNMTKGRNDIGAILLECSMLPPYSEMVQKETELAVYDFITMIDFVSGAFVKPHYSDIL